MNRRFHEGAQLVKRHWFSEVIERACLERSYGVIRVAKRGNYGAGQIKRCKKTMQLSFLEGAIATFVSVVVLLLSARSLLAIFNSDPEVIAIGYIRLATILPAYVFCLIYEILSGYLRGFGISLAPALLTMLGVCGIRIAWVKFVFPTSMTFQTVMWVYPISLGATAVLILCAVLIYRPSRRFAGLETEEEDK